MSKRCKGIILFPDNDNNIISFKCGKRGWVPPFQLYKSPQQTLFWITYSQTFNIPSGFSRVEYLLVGGGGSGGGGSPLDGVFSGGGGGSGVVSWGIFNLGNNSSILCNVGIGGASVQMFQPGLPGIQTDITFVQSANTFIALPGQGGSDFTTGNGGDFSGGGGGAAISASTSSFGGLPGQGQPGQGGINYDGGSGGNGPDISILFPLSSFGSLLPSGQGGFSSTGASIGDVSTPGGGGGGVGTQKLSGDGIYTVNYYGLGGNGFGAGGSGGVAVDDGFADNPSGFGAPGVILLQFS